MSNVWQTIVELPPLIPLNETDIQAVQLYEKPNWGAIHRLGERCYMRNRLPDKVPTIGTVFWADDDQAIRRAVFHEIEEYSGPVANRPPQQLVSAVEPTYGTILGDVSLRGIKPLETGSYRGTDGQWLHRVLDARALTFYFLDRRASKGELPYAVEVSLRKFRDLSTTR